MKQTSHFAKALRIMSCATLLSAAALASMSTFAEPPPYGPDADPWGGCVDMDTNGTGGIVTVICPAIIAPNTPPNAPTVARARTTCLTRADATFGEIKSKYLCVFPSKTPVGRAAGGKAQFSAGDWKQFRRLAGRVRGEGECPPNFCNDFKSGPVKPTPTNPPPPAASARPCPAYKGDPCDGKPGQI